ncbi:TDT family transporter [Pararhodospirillum oryzae]|uniref:C4-dicarboxylate ABC transporter n=1 Tax=Pararhodospirillum oryzae TaxID=478448 RepID=A0A512H6F8_9PROT|nr:TDT family transporter [Pararhodospirillum oryzae]GEO81049.1 C4-dicarboxylate ABC transporter [Pararhodospirillum oryzae]
MSQVSSVASPVPVAGNAGPWHGPLAGRLRHMIREFTPNWFAVTMGTGVLGLILPQFPLPVPGLHALGFGVWLVDVALFVLFSVLYAARWILYPAEALRTFSHPVASMFFGTIPMGLATVTNGLMMFGIPLWGAPAVALAHALWWVDAGLAVACGLVIPYLMVTRQEHRMERMTAVWLLPIVAAEVAAVSAGQLAPHLGLADGFLVTILGYVLWAFSVPLAMSVLVILFLRLVLHSLPEREMAASGWLSLGPIGTAALGLVVLGNDAPTVFAPFLPGVGDIAHGVGVIGALMFWGYGVWWLLLAVLKTLRYSRQGIPFNMGWWAFTFPLGVYTLATLALARVTGLAFFSVSAAVLTVMLTGFWGMVAAGTARGVWRGTVFNAPCLR